MALYKVEDAAKVVDSLRYTEVRQVDLQQLMMLKELLDEMAESGGVVSKMLTSHKVFQNIFDNRKKKTSISYQLFIIYL